MQALYHEQVHSFFTPKGPLSEVRANISMGAYNKSHLLRYTEEALAESVSQLRTRGQTGVGILGNLWEGLLLPLNPSYNLKRSRILLEAALYGGTIVGTSYVTTKLLGK